MDIKTIKRGALIRVWHQDPRDSVRRGHLYVPIGKDDDKQLLYLLKANSFNKDGTLHKSVKSYHLALPYEKEGRKKVVRARVSYVDKSSRNVQEWSREFFKVLPAVAEVLSPSERFDCVLKGVKSS